MSVFHLLRAWARYIWRWHVRDPRPALKRQIREAQKRRKADWERKVKGWPANDNRPDERRAWP